MVGHRGRLGCLHGAGVPLQQQLGTLSATAALVRTPLGDDKACLCSSDLLGVSAMHSAMSCAPIVTRGFRTCVKTEGQRGLRPTLRDPHQELPSGDSPTHMRANQQCNACAPVAMRLIAHLLSAASVLVPWAHANTRLSLWAVGGLWVVKPRSQRTKASPTAHGSFALCLTLPSGTTSTRQTQSLTHAFPSGLWVGKLWSSVGRLVTRRLL